MKVSRIVSEVDVVGRIWQPGCGLCAYTYPLSGYDVENIRAYGDGEITRDAVQRWLDTHAGDFSEIVDFRATIGDGDFDCDFEDEDNEMAYNTAMFGDE